MSHDILVVGDGVIGLTTALLLAQQDHDIALLVRSTPQSPSAAPRTAQVYALNRASEQLLQRCGVWQQLLPNCCAPYEGMQVWDGDNAAEINFDASAVAEPNIGHIVWVPQLRWQLWQAVSQHKNIHLYHAKSDSLCITEQQVQLHTTQECITASLLLAADGAQSWVRAQLDAAIQQWSYGQQAITALVRTEKAHERIARQVFLATGPLALLPMAEPHVQAMVWSADDVEAQRLQQMETEDLAQTAATALAGSMGSLQFLSDRRAFPLTMRHIKQYCRARVAWIGDAAHTVHPLAGQGANLGLMDVQAIVAVLQRAKKAGVDLGDLALLQSYERRRQAANWRMILGCEALKRLFGNQHIAAMSVRHWGMRFLQGQSFIKRQIIRYALQPHPDNIMKSSEIT